MKRTTLHLVVVLFFLGSARADQTVQSVQQALKDQGFYYGNVTGEKSAETTSAVRRYQIRNGLQVNGEINPETLRSLNVSSNSASPPPVTSTSRITQPTDSGRNDGARPLLNSSPDSFTAIGRRAEGDGVPVGTSYELAPGDMHARIVTEVQRQLWSLGYYRGRIHGRYGRRIVSAVRAFQSRSGIWPTGQLDARTLDALGLPAEDVAYLDSTRQSDGSREWVDKNVKHGKSKAKWKKHHRGGDEYADEHDDANDDGRGD
jgi:peptidoglycan hydrolase-like protein with peptidoglycan-binding domain